MNTQEKNQIPSYLLVLACMFVFYLLFQTFIVGWIYIYSYVLMAVVMGWAILSKRIESKVFLVWTSLTQAIIYVSLLFILISSLYVSYPFSGGIFSAFSILRSCSYLIIIFFLINLHRFYKKQLVETGGIAKMRKFLIILLAVILPLMPYAEIPIRTSFAFSSMIKLQVDSDFDIIRNIYYSPDGSKIAAIIDNSKYLEIFDTHTGKSISKITMPGYIFDLSFSPEGRYLAIGHTGEANPKKDGDVRIDVWDLTLNQPVTLKTEEAIKKAQEYFPKAFISPPVGFSPDGKYLATIIRDAYWSIEVKKQYVGLWDTKTWELSRVVNLDDAAASSSAEYDSRDFSFEAFLGSRFLYTPDSKYLVAKVFLNKGTHIGFIDLSSGEVAKVFDSPDSPGLISGIDSFAISRDGDYLAIAATLQNESDRFAPLKIIIEISNLHTGNREQIFEYTSPSGMGSILEDIAYSPDGKYLASVDGNGSVRLWDAKKGILIETLTGNPIGEGLWGRLAFSPDGRYLALGKDDYIKFWDVAGK